MLIFFLSCSLAEVDTSSTESVDDSAAGGGAGATPTITTLEVLWQEFGNEGVVMYADATVEDTDNDLVGGLAKFDVAADGESPIGFEVTIEDCADVSGACWIPPHLIIAIPDVITSNDYNVELWVVDVAGHTSESATGWLAGG